jgi:hypothetical protein
MLLIVYVLSLTSSACSLMSFCGYSVTLKNVPVNISMDGFQLQGLEWPKLVSHAFISISCFFLTVMSISPRCSDLSPIHMHRVVPFFWVMFHPLLIGWNNVLLSVTEQLVKIFSWRSFMIFALSDCTIDGVFLDEKSLRAPRMHWFWNYLCTAKIILFSLDPQHFVFLRPQQCNGWASSFPLPFSVLFELSSGAQHAVVLANILFSPGSIKPTFGVIYEIF